MDVKDINGKHVNVPMMVTTLIVGTFITILNRVSNADEGLQHFNCDSAVVVDRLHAGKRDYDSSIRISECEGAIKMVIHECNEYFFCWHIGCLHCK